MQASWLISTCIPLPDVAARQGTGLDVLIKTYAHSIESLKDNINSKILESLVGG